MTNENSQIHIVEYDEVASQIEEVKELANFLPDVTSDEGYEKSKRVSLDIGKLLTALERMRKEKKAYFLQGGKEVDKQAKAIVTKLEVFQRPHKEAYKKLDEKKREREAKRKEDLELRIKEIVGMPNRVIELNMNSVQIKRVIDKIASIKCDDFDEFKNAAISTREDSLQRLNKIFIDVETREKEAEELERLRAEQSKRDQEEHNEAICQEEDAKAKQEVEAAKAFAKEQEFAAERASAVIVQQLKDAQIEKERAVEQAHQDEIYKQKAKEKAQAEEVVRRKENNKHVEKICKEAAEYLTRLGCSVAFAKDIVLAIHHHQVKNISITY